MASPPHVPQLNIPRKRSSISSISSTAKKRKPSNLRNSFAPESEIAVGSPARFSRSPSVESAATGSVANGAGGKKRKRRDGDAVSATGSNARGAQRQEGASAINGDAGDGAENEEDDDLDDNDLDDDVNTMLEGDRTTEASKKQEKEHERILMEAMNNDQFERYERYRRVKLRIAIVRRLVNQTLSQSVPQPVIIAVMSYSKAFIGELIDRALNVRDEWSASRTHLPQSDMHPQLLQQGLHEPFGHRSASKPNNSHIQQAGLFPQQVPDRDMGFWNEVAKDTPLADRLKECDKGPLTSAHLQEALRRYKRDREGGGAGFAGYSLEGPERMLGRSGGKRLFR